MILKGLKEKSNKKLINKLQSKRLVTDSKRKIKSVAFLYVIEKEEDVKKHEALLVKFSKQFNTLNSVALDLRKKPQKELEVQTFNAKSIGWKGKVKSNTLSDFLKQDYDVLINFYTNNIVPLHVVNAKTKALIKVGLFQTEHDLNDLIIDTAIEKPDVFLAEMLKYLKILNPKHND
ncbi:DUF6913 domain-containing protein [Lacinutrix salivirga]